MEGHTHHVHSADGWVLCGCGNKHWGRRGAAGLLAFSPDLSHVLLQHRALWSHHGGTWGIPGGAIAYGESPIQAARRESAEEAGVDPNLLRVLATHTLLHPDWSYTTVIAHADRQFAAQPTDAESLEIAWQPIGAVPELELLPAFSGAFPKLLELVQTAV